MIPIRITAFPIRIVMIPIRIMIILIGIPVTPIRIMAHGIGIAAFETGITADNIWNTAFESPFATSDTPRKTQGPPRLFCSGLRVRKEDEHRTGHGRYSIERWLERQGAVQLDCIVSICGKRGKKCLFTDLKLGCMSSSAWKPILGSANFQPCPVIGTFEVISVEIVLFLFGSNFSLYSPE